MKWQGPFAGQHPQHPSIFLTLKKQGGGPRAASLKNFFAFSLSEADGAPTKNKKVGFS